MVSLIIARRVMLFETQTDFVATEKGTPSRAQLPFQGLHCQVEYFAGGDILFVRCQHVVQCQHQLLFGGGCICQSQACLNLYRQQH